MSTASHSRQRKPQRVLVAGETVFVHRRKDGAHGRCGPGVCVLSEEPKPGRKETVWVHMRNCLHQCNRTQVRPATNEEAEGIETVTGLLPSLSEAVRERRTRHFADITDEGDPEDDEPMVVEGDVMDVRLGRPDSQPEPELNAPANSDATSRSARSETHAEPEAEASTSAGTDMEIGVRDRRVRFREGDSSRHHLDVSSDRVSMEEPRGKIPRRVETSESLVTLRSFRSKLVRASSQVSAAATSDNPTKERLYMSMTEEGPSGDYRLTMQRDQHRRSKGRETKLYVGESKEHGTFSIASADASPLHGEFYLSRRNADEVSWNHLSDEDRTQFSKAIETVWQGVLDFKAVTIIDPTQADVIREKQRERVVSSRLVLFWTETDTGYKAKARWCVHGSKNPDIHEIERSCPTPELSSINSTVQIPASTNSEGTLADGEKAFMQGEGCRVCLRVH